MKQLYDILNKKDHRWHLATWIVRTIIVIHCIASPKLLNAQMWQIGDIYTFPDGGRGVVFYISPNNPHKGCVVALNDLIGEWQPVCGERPSLLAAHSLAEDTVFVEGVNDGKRNTSVLREANYFQEADSSLFDKGWYIPDMKQLQTIIWRAGLLKVPMEQSGGNLIELLDHPHFSSTAYYSPVRENLFFLDSYQPYTLTNGSLIDLLILMLEVKTSTQSQFEEVFNHYIRTWDNGLYQEYTIPGTGKTGRLRLVRDFGDEAEAYWEESPKNGYMMVSPETSTPYHGVVVYGTDTFRVTSSAYVHENFDKDTIYEITCVSPDPYTSIHHPAFTGIDVSVAQPGYLSFRDTMQTVHGCDSIITLRLRVVEGCENTETDTICPITADHLYAWKDTVFMPNTVSGIYERVGRKWVDDLWVDTVAFLNLTVMPAYAAYDTVSFCVYTSPMTLPYAKNAYVTITENTVLSSSSAVVVETVSSSNYVIKMRTVHDCDSLIYLRVNRYLPVDPPTLAVAPDALVCPGDTAELTFTPTAAQMDATVSFTVAYANESGVEYRSYSSLSGNTIIDRYVPVSATKVYPISADDGRCEYTSFSDTAMLTLRDDIADARTIITVPDTTCLGGSAQLSAKSTLSAPYKISWYADSTLSHLLQEENIASNSSWSYYDSAGLAKRSVVYVGVVKDGICPTRNGVPVTAELWPRYEVTIYDEVCQSQTNIYDDPYHVTPSVVALSTLNRAIRKADTYYFTRTLRNADQHGCDSVVNFILKVNSAHYDTTVFITNLGSGSYTWHGTTYSEAGRYGYTFTTETGCDRIDTLNLVVLEVDVEDHEICEGDSVELTVSVTTPATKGVLPGDIYCTDGTILTADSFLTSGKTAKGVIFHVDNTGEHGLMLALGETGTRWLYDRINGSSNEQLYYAVGTSITVDPKGALFDRDGRGNTDEIKRNVEQVPGANFATNTPAAYYCYYYDHNTKTVGTDSLGWYMPASGELALLALNMSAVNTSLTKLQSMDGTVQLLLNGEKPYHSSTPAKPTDAVKAMLGFENNDAYDALFVFGTYLFSPMLHYMFYMFEKDDNAYVRAITSF